MRHSHFVVLLGAVVLTFTACNSVSERNNDTSNKPTVSQSGNLAHDMLLELDADARAATLGSVVTASGDKCRGNAAFFRGMNPKDNEAYWSVRCTNGKSYEVTIEANATGDTNVVNCSILKAVADADCFEKLDAAPRPPRTKKQIKADIDRLSPALKKQMTEQLRERLGR